MALLHRMSHLTWKFTAICLGIVLGIALAGQFSTFYHVPWLVIGIVFCLISLLRPWTYLLILAIVGGIFIGLWRGSLDSTALDIYKPVYGSTVRLRGVIAEDPTLNAKGMLIMQLSKISSNGKNVPGKVWVMAENRDDLRRSDNIEVEGKLEEGFGTFAGSMYRAQIVNVERIVPGDLALEARNAASDGVRRAIDEPAASLGIGYLLGQKRELPSGLTEALMVTGLTHVVVASGYNLTILVRLARKTFEKHSKYLTVLAGLLLVGIFIAVTGLSPSMSRAGLVTALGLAAWYYGRTFHPVTLLLLTMSVTAAINPSYVWGDLGWALSFAAFGGVMIVAPALQAFFVQPGKETFIGKLLIETIAAQISTLPIILVAFGKLSVIALFANMLIVPLVPLAMLLTFFGGLIGIVAPVIAFIVGWPAEVLLGAMIWVIEWCAQIPWAQLSVEVGWQPALIMYIGLGMLTFILLKLTGYRLRNASILE